MAVLYRIVKTKYAADAFDGTGARKHGGRWNSKGNAVCYVADTPSLAVLETLVHLLDPSILPYYTLCTITIDESDILAIESKDLPAGWSQDPALISTAMIGDEWYTGQASLALRVPSSIITEQFNYLINTTHPKFASVLSTVVCKPYPLDERLKQTDIAPK